uniref:M96 mating-specific protein family n=1 Tax=Globisporangium ultimum (strain ATCC 200006 / CBS 805.95 / DAOM BR144) TaxID=431595 RepID=K3W9L6_GLOUD
MAIGNDTVLHAAHHPAPDLQRHSPQTVKNEQLDDDDEKRRASTAMAIVELLGGAGNASSATGATEWFAQPPLKTNPTTILPSLQPLKRPLWSAAASGYGESGINNGSSKEHTTKTHVLIQPLPSIAQLAANMSVSDRLSVRIPSSSAPPAASSTLETKTESSSATVVPTPTTTPVSVNHSRKRQKDELDKLRVQVQELQRELEHVRARLPKKPQVYTLSSTGAIGLSNEMQASVPSSVTIWERIASHQKEQKNKSEMENMKLKSMVQEQVKISKALEKLVNKRCKNSSLEAKFAAKRLRVCDSEEQFIFDSLSKSLDERYQQVDAVFEKLGMAYQKRERQEANMILDTINGPTMELKDATIFPFDVQSINEAVWRSMEVESLGCKENNMGMIESLMVQSSEDTVCIKTSIPLRQPRAPESDLSMRCVMKRYVEKNRVVILWESVSDCLAKLVQCAGRGVEVRDRGWCMIESLPSPPGRHSSIIQLCSHIAPRMSGESAHVSMQHMHGLVDTVAPCYRYIWGNRQQIMENLLMENVVGLPRPPSLWPGAAE